MPTLPRAARLLIAALSLLALLSACSDAPQPTTETPRPTATVRPIIKPTNTATVATFQIQGAPTPATCQFTYTEAAAANAAPVISPAVTTGC